MGGKEGENPELRALFFRTLNLLETPMIPLFVFDGRERPRVKRGSKVGKAGSHKFTAKMKEMLDIFGIEWRMVRLLMSLHTTVHTVRILMNVFIHPSGSRRG